MQLGLMQNQDPKKNRIQSLYDGISEHFDIGEFEPFREKMKSHTNRLKLYDELNKHGFDIGDVDSYESKVEVAMNEYGFSKFALPFSDERTGMMYDYAPKPKAKLNVAGNTSKELKQVILDRAEEHG